MSRYNEKRTTIHEYEDINVKVRYLWLADNKVLDVSESLGRPFGWLHSKVRVDLYEFTEHFESMDQDLDVKVLQLFINDEYVGELNTVEEKVTDYNQMILSCGVIIGNG